MTLNLKDSFHQGLEFKLSLLSTLDCCPIKLPLHAVDLVVLIIHIGTGFLVRTFKQLASSSRELERLIPAWRHLHPLSQAIDQLVLSVPQTPWEALDLTESLYLRIRLDILLVVLLRSFAVRRLLGEAEVVLEHVDCSAFGT